MWSRSCSGASTGVAATELLSLEPNHQLICGSAKTGHVVRRPARQLSSEDTAMNTILQDYPFRCVLSFEPLLDYWNRDASSFNGGMPSQAETIREGFRKAPELQGLIEDLSTLKSHRDFLRHLMSPVFPPALWESEPLAAVVPFSLQPVFCSPLFQGIFFDEAGDFKGRPFAESDRYVQARVLRAYFLILRKCYGLRESVDLPLIHVVPDGSTGLDRYYGFRPNFRFCEVRNVSGPKELSEDQRNFILEHITDPTALREALPPENYEFRGFTVLHALDVTEHKVMSALDRDLVDKDSFVSEAGFIRLQQRLRTLFRLPDLVAGLAAVQGDKVLVLNTGCKKEENCIFAASNHLPVSQFNGSVFEKAVKAGKPIRIRDILREPNHTAVETEMIQHGVRSAIIAPLEYGGRTIGALKLASPNADEFGPTEELLANTLLPRFSMALKRALDELDNNVESIIKEKCTAVHPSVEWRFKKAVLDHLESVHKGEASELEPIVFRDVYPLYGASDIRGSSRQRNTGILSDVTDHLNRSLDIIQSALEVRRLFVLQELSERIAGHLDRVHEGFGTGDEASVMSFLHREVEPLFPALSRFGSPVAQAVAKYREAIDPEKRTVYHKRKDFEESVSLFNERVSLYLEREEDAAQKVFPHYFDKHQTDGIDYVIYMGGSMVENREFHELYVRNMRIWQMIVSCGIAWHAEQLKGVLKVPLETTHLILVNHSPLSIRFRFDEKRFDVDGAYDVAHEIIRSRIDKATVGDRAERLTQPAKIALVYSRPEEGNEMMLHISFLQKQGFLTDEVEKVELDELQDVKGMKAIRVGIDLASRAVADRVKSMAL